MRTELLAGGAVDLQAALLVVFRVVLDEAPFITRGTVERAADLCGRAERDIAPGRTAHSLRVSGTRFGEEVVADPISAVSSRSGWSAQRLRLAAN